jgi:predicted dehydrogenase
MQRQTRWGILATGNIARKFAEGLADVEGARLVACASRSQDRARAFADQFDVPRAHGSYQALARDDEVDVVYIATPHPFHHDNALACLEAGKAVLVEKPFAVNARQGREIVQAARRKGLFCMEAMWTRFFPVMVQLRQILADGRIGQVRMLQADFGFRCNRDPQHRLLNPDLGGGGLLDVGIYPLSLASMVLGEFKHVTGLAEIGDTGVDTQAGIVGRHPGDRISVLSCAVQTATPREAWILGTQGRVHLPDPWFAPRSMTIRDPDGSEEAFEPPATGNGYNHQARAVGDCLARGQTENPDMPLDETLAILETMDQLRDQWDLVYPFET